jgi:hypothetical protein
MTGDRAPDRIPHSDARRSSMPVHSFEVCRSVSAPLRRHVIGGALCAALALSAPALLAATQPAAAAPPSAAKAAPRLGAEQILARNLAARGGQQAWRNIQGLAMSGRMEAGFGDSVARSARYVSGATQPASKKARAALLAASAPALPGKQVELPFVLDMARPAKSRLELVFSGKTAVQVFDGSNGWKLRPFLNRNDVEDFTPAELKAQQGEDEIGGPLLNLAADGAKLSLEGVEPVDGHEAYKLRLTARNGDVRHVWVDAQSFLDVKIEGAPRTMDGRPHAVVVYQRDFRDVQGVKIPFALETVVDGYADSHKIAIDKVSVNPKFDGAVFARPGA